MPGRQGGRRRGEALASLGRQRASQRETSLVVELGEFDTWAGMRGFPSVTSCNSAFRSSSAIKDVLSHSIPTNLRTPALVTCTLTAPSADPGELPLVREG